MTFELTELPLLSRSTLDRATHLRTNSEALEQGWATASILRIDKRGQFRIADGALVLDPAVSVADKPPVEAVFLGVDSDVHVWAVLDETLDGDLSDLRRVGPLDDTALGVLTSAIALVNWHRKARFSPVDGSPTTPSQGGWARVNDRTGHDEFPRTDPAVICLVHDGADRVLLARQHVWPPTMFSILAGFVEAGESLEACVAREIREEVGIDTRDIRYLGSQPWPFPRSVMLGFAAVADPEQPLVFADGEIAEAYWFTRDEVRAALEHGDWTSKAGVRLLLPGSISIARTIVEAWAAAG